MAAERKFTFNSLSGKEFNSLTNKDNRDYLMKWSMKDRLRIDAFSFDEQFKSYEKDAFVKAFFQDPSVVHNIHVASPSGKVQPLGITAKTTTAEFVPCSVLSMDFFDRLKDRNIVRESGKLMKCFDEFYEDIVISDELRKVLLLEDSDNYDLYSESEREEFLFLLFRHLCLGGAVCQFEDVIEPYLQLTKLLYKDLISVQKEAESGKLHITSSVFKVTASVSSNTTTHWLKDDNGMFFPSSEGHLQDFAYLVIDPLKRHVYLLHHKYGACVFN